MSDLHVLLYLHEVPRVPTQRLSIHVPSQPLHFGAASGMGLCYLQMGEYNDAIEAFEVALKIHPGLDDIRRIVGELRSQGYGGQSVGGSYNN